MFFKNKVLVYMRSKPRKTGPIADPDSETSTTMELQEDTACAT